MNLLPELFFASAAAAALLALGVALRPRRSVPRWAFVATLAVLAAEALLAGLAARAGSPVRAMAWQEKRLLALAFLPATAWLFTATYGRDRRRAWFRRHAWLLALLVVLPVVLAGRWRDDLLAFLPRPVTTAPVGLALGWSGAALMLVVLVVSIGALLNLERTFRAAIGTTRWRLKFVLLGFAVVLGVRLYTSSQALLFRGLEGSIDSLNAAATLLGALLMVRGLLRAGHFELQVYPSHTVLQHSLTFLVAGVYLIVVGGLARLVATWGGGLGVALNAFLLLAALVALAVFLQSDRARLHLRRFVSRHFQRPLHDYRAAWRKFTEGTAAHVDPTALAHALVRLIAAEFQALSVTLWLCDETAREVRALASSHPTPPHPPPAPALATAGAAATDGALAALGQHFRAHPEPADFETAPDAWAEALRTWHPRLFPHGGRRVVVPLFGRDALLGLITIGDRVGGVPYTLQDFDMLKCVGDHAAANLLNRQLYQQLVQNRELAAFQSMATFFIHDLKNAASTLSLMVQNLPEHWNDPAFRVDALRGIDRTVTHINLLIGKLGQLRQAHTLQLAPTDLNQLLRLTVAGLELRPDLTLDLQLGALPSVPLDAAQLQKVVTNLVLNASEAITATGTITLATRAVATGVQVTVADTGCGMSDQFIRDSLFRPFQTTKAGGLGIGMFQSKTIVAAHGGRLEVTSQPGRGTTFTLFLPAPPARP